MTKPTITTVSVLLFFLQYFLLSVCMFVLCFFYKTGTTFCVCACVCVCVCVCSQLRAILTLREHLAMFGDIFGCHSGGGRGGRVGATSL